MWIYSGLIPKLPTCDIEDLPDCSKSLCPAFLSSWFLQWIHNCFQGAWFFLFTVFFSLYNCGLFQWLVCYALLTLSSTLEVICHIGSKWVWCPDLLALSHSLFTGIILLLSDKADQTCNPETSGFFFLLFLVWFGACNESALGAFAALLCMHEKYHLPAPRVGEQVSKRNICPKGFPQRHWN